MIDLERIKKGRDIREFINIDFDEILLALEEAKRIMFECQNHVDREKWIRLCARRDQWNKKYFGEK